MSLLLAARRRVSGAFALPALSSAAEAGVTTQATVTPPARPARRRDQRRPRPPPSRLRPRQASASAHGTTRANAKPSQARPAQGDRLDRVRPAPRRAPSSRVRSRRARRAGATRRHRQHLSGQAANRGRPRAQRAATGERRCAGRQRAARRRRSRRRCRSLFSQSLAGIPASSSKVSACRLFCCRSIRPPAPPTACPWQVLAAINEVETDYGRDLSVSSAGAEGWMQFLPSEWAHLRRRRQRRRLQGPLQPGRRDLRRRALPARRRRAHQPAGRDLRLQPLAGVRRNGAAARAAARAARRPNCSVRSPG